MVDVQGDVLRPPHGTTPAAVKKHFLFVMHKWTWFIAITLKYCINLYLSLNFCNGFNRQKQKKKKKK